MTGHSGLDGSDMTARAERYVIWMGLGENIAYAKYSDTSGYDVIT